MTTFRLVVPVAQLCTMTPPTLDIKFKNTCQADLYATITGLDLDHNSQWFVLKADGKSAYHPENPSGIGSPLTEDCAIKIGGHGAERTVTIPHIAGGRIYFSIHEPVTFLLNHGPALVEPSVTNPSDANYNKNWGFCEFTVRPLRAALSNWCSHFHSCSHSLLV